jgi:hypothetical protein
MSQPQNAFSFAVGYQEPDNGELFSDIVADYQPQVGEVYFAWVGMPSGRAILGAHENRDAVQELLEEELKTLRSLGVKLDLLFNANCYGAHAFSRELEKQVRGIVDYLGEQGCQPDIITTTSPAIAHICQQQFPDIERRASVNMRIGSTQAMNYLGELFDSFCLQRDRQRDFRYLAKIHQWCQKHHKKLCLLANSGCLKYCPAQSFHDNFLAHLEKLERVDNMPGWNPHLCWTLYRQPENFVEFLRATWVRPEDLHHYAGMVDTVKLATRQHSHPRMVIAAYVNQAFAGDLLGLTEPGFSTAFTPYYIDNQAFPPDWAERIAQCPEDCDSCHYCQDILKTVLKNSDEGF